MDGSERYSRQHRFAPIGPDGQQRIARSRVLLVGCGALGTVTAEQLVRAGVGLLRLVDRDFVEWSNLQRQSLFTEADAEQQRPKAVAAAERLAALNSDCQLQPVVAHCDARRLTTLLEDIDLVLDGTDNFATRHLINDACCRAGLPWIYAACVGSYALSLPVLPGRSACLRCLQDELPEAGDGPTCDAAGIIAPAVHIASGWQVAEALKILSGATAAVRRELWACDCWSGSLQRLDLTGFRDPACRSCSPTADHPALAEASAPATVLCGRDAIQFPASGRPVDLTAVATALGDRLLIHNDHLLRWADGELRGTLFTDGRVLVQGCAEVDRARAFVDRWLG